MTELGRALRHHPGAPAIALAAYLVGGLVLFPITLLLAGTALVFPSGTAVGLCLVGTLAGAAETYGIGRLLGRYRPRSLEHPRFVQLERQLRRRGFITIIAARMLPVGNFSLINMTAGALPIPFATTCWETPSASSPASSASPSWLSGWARRYGNHARSISCCCSRWRSPCSWAGGSLAAATTAAAAATMSRLKCRLVQHPPMRGHGRGGATPVVSPRCSPRIDADVICLQEVSTEPGLASDSMQMEFLAASAGAACGGQARPSCAVGLGHYGNALLTRRPILDVRRVNLTVYQREPRAAVDVDLDGGAAAPCACDRHASRTACRASAGNRSDGCSTSLSGSRVQAYRPVWGHERVVRRSAGPCAGCTPVLGARAGLPTFPAAYPVFALDRVWVDPAGAIRALSVHATPGRPAPGLGPSAHRGGNRACPSLEDRFPASPGDRPWRSPWLCSLPPPSPRRPPLARAGYGHRSVVWT